MSLVRFLIVLGLGTILSWSAWVLVLLTLDPFQTGFIAMFLFSMSLWLGMVGLGTLIGFFIRYWLERDSIPFRQIAIALRQSILVSSGIILALLLLTARWLHWWSVVIVLALVVLTEFFFLAGTARRPRAT